MATGPEPPRMGEAARLVGGATGVLLGAALLLVGAYLLWTGPLVQAHQESWWWVLGGREASGATIAAVGVLGVLLVVLGGYLMAVGLKGAMGTR